jgi:hypothetical protein
MRAEERIVPTIGRSHSIAMSADPCADDVRLSEETESLFTCAALGKRGADVRRDWQRAGRQMAEGQPAAGHTRLSPYAACSNR